MKQPRDGKEVMMLIMMEYSFRGLDSQSAIVIVSVEINGIFFFLFKCLVSIKISHLHGIRMKVIS